MYPEISWSGRCAIQGVTSLTMLGESFVLAGEKASQFLLFPAASESVEVRNTYLPGQPDTVVYEAGRDYVLDMVEGSIRRTIRSRIPDYSAHPWYDKTGFARKKYTMGSNKPYFIYVDYRTDKGCPLFDTSPKTSGQRLASSAFFAGQAVSIAVYGDSICTGAEASQPSLSFAERWVKSLKSRFPQKSFQLHNISRGGMSSADGVASLSEAFLGLKPDLVLIGFGMNDFNTPLQAFKTNLRTMGREISRISGAKIIFMSAFPAHPDWYHFKANRRMPELARATKEIAGELGAGYVGVFEVWERVLSRKDFSSLLANNLNHPNDFGHWLYFVACDTALFLPK